jgi:VanZ family protein
MVMIFVASGESEVAAPGFFPDVDKLSHFSVFGLLATLVLRMFFDENRPARTALFAAIGVSLYGMTDEYRQSFTPGRSVEFADWMADTLGAIVAVSAYGFWGGWRRFLERPLRRPTATSPSNVAPAGSPVDASSAR